MTFQWVLREILAQGIERRAAAAGQRRSVRGVRGSGGGNLHGEITHGSVGHWLLMGPV